MNFEHLKMIRDARGLSAWDKMFLMTVALRGEMYCTWQRNCEDMGMKKDRYYKSRDYLLENKLIEATRRMDDTTVYLINEAGLQSWMVAHSVTQNGHSATQNTHSVTQKSHSVRPEPKKNTKKNMKKNIEEEPDEAAGASPSPLSENKNNKEDHDPAILIGSNDPAVPMVDNTPAHSVSQNEDDYYEWNGRKVLRAGRRGMDTTAPVETVEKPKCSNCNKREVFHVGLCWDCGA